MCTEIDPQPVLRPLEVFDPAADGWEGKSLGGVIEAGEAAMAALDAYRMALHACTAPLHLLRENTELKDMGASLAAQVDELSRARDVIEADAPLARAFTGSPSWTEKPSVVLSPRQINALSAPARTQSEPENTTTYREVIAAAADDATLPPLIALHRKNKLSQEDGSADRMAVVNAARDRLILQILAEMESVECETCGAREQQACRTASGFIAERPHAPRYRSSPLARANKDESWLATRRKADGWVPAPVADLLDQPGGRRDTGQRSAAAATDDEHWNRTKLRQVVGGVAESLADLDR